MQPTILTTAYTVAITLFLMACSARAQTVNIWPGVAPGSENWTQQERTIENTPVGTVIFNVVTPTLTAYLPNGRKATGTGIIIAPGGVSSLWLSVWRAMMSPIGFKREVSLLSFLSIG
jgi:hypothetical protein